MPIVGSVSKHAAGCQFVRDKVTSGEWKPGDRLPSQAAWAAGTSGLELKYGTLRGVYLTLKTEGWIEGVQGEGVFVAKNPPVPTPTRPTKPAGRVKSLARKDRG